MRFNMDRTHSAIDFHTYGQRHSDERSPTGHKRTSLEPPSQIKQCFDGPTGSSRHDPQRQVAAKVTQRDQKSIEKAARAKLQEWNTIINQN